MDIVLPVLPVAARATVGFMAGFTRAMTATLGTLVLVTSLVPVFAVCMAALGARPPDEERFRRSSGSARESA
jgi:hypothetical protein